MSSLLAPPSTRITSHNSHRAGLAGGSTHANSSLVAPLAQLSSRGSSAAAAYSPSGDLNAGGANSHAGTDASVSSDGSQQHSTVRGKEGGGSSHTAGAQHSTSISAGASTVASAASNSSLSRPPPSSILTPLQVPLPSAPSVRVSASAGPARALKSHTSHSAAQQSGGVSGSAAAALSNVSRVPAAKLLQLEESSLELKSEMAKKEEYIKGLQRNCETLAALCASQLHRQAQRQSQHRRLPLVNSLSFVSICPLFSCVSEHMQQVSLLKSDLDRITGEKYLLEMESHKTVSNEVLAQRLSKENEELLTQKKSLSTRVETLQSKVYAAQQQSSELLETKQELTQSLQRERNLHASVKMEVDELRSILSDTAEKKKGSAAQGAGAHEFERKIQTLKFESEANKSALDALQIEHKALQSASTKAANIASRVQFERDALEGDNARLKKGLGVLRKEHAESRERAEKAESENAELREALATIQASLAPSSKRLPELEAALKTSEKERIRLKKSFEEAWSSREDLVLQLSDLKAELELSKKRGEILARATPRQPTTSATPDANELERVRDEMAEAAKRLDASKSQIAELDASAKRWESKYDDALKAKTALQSELDAAQTSNLSLSNSLRAARSASGSAKDLESEITALKAQLASASNGFSIAQREAADAQQAAAKSEQALKELREQLTTLTTDHAAALLAMKNQADAHLAKTMAETERAAAATSRSLLAAQHRVAELEALMDNPRLSAADVSKLAKREAELQACVAKLVVNEEASEASFTCFACMNVFTKPVTCIPCGHSFCTKSVIRCGGPEQAGRAC
jgi:chromosome segregation ATPase